MTENTDILIREYQDKLVYYYKRIDETNEKIRIIKEINEMKSGKLVSLSASKDVL